MSRRELVLNLSTLRLTIRFEDAELAYQTLRSVWHQAARVRFVPVRHEVVYDVQRAGDRLVLRVDGGHVRKVDREEDVAPLIEGGLYTDLLRTQQEDGLTVLHASCCVMDGQPIVFAGVSGSGKSALARAAVEAGLSYLGDEHIFSDGSHVWGLPRAIHMDAHAETEPRLPWHQGADLESYRCRNAENKWFRLPIVPVADASVAASPANADRTVLVALRRGAATSLTRMNAAARLRTLEEAHFVRGPALASLALVDSAFALTWSDPASALDQLRSALR